MTWVTTVGVDGGRLRATTWVMMWAMWTTGTMAATTPATTPAKGMAGTPAGRGGGAPGGGHGVGGGGGGDGGGGGGCILQGSLLFIVKIFLCGFFLGSSAKTRLPTTFVFSCAVTVKCIIKTHPCGEGQTKAQICPAKWKALLIPFSEQTAP
jgi:hypothetical protein